jgi:uncharacterized phage protein gp47/JayE
MALSGYGVTSTGFSRPRLAEIKTDLETDFKEAFGLEINTRSDSVMGQLIGVLTEREAIWWETAEAVYNAMYPHTGADTSLTNAVAFTGVQRISAEKTSTYITCYGTNGTTILADSQVKSSSDSTITFSTEDSGSIALTAACYLDLTVSSVTEGAAYTVTIDGTAYSYTALSTDDETSILVALATLMTALESTVTTSNKHLIIDKTDPRTGYSVSITSNFTVSKLGSPAEFLCDEYGSTDPAIGTLTNIVTQVSGWDSCENEYAATVGRDDEVDADLRTRYARAVYKTGKTQVEAIAANIYENVDGVTTALCFENDTDSTDSEGRPPHSIEVVVLGGADTDIAQEIWDNKAPGITTYGDVAVEIKDSQGVRHTMNFNRPTIKMVWLKVALTGNNDETMPADTASTAADIILEKGEAYTVGQDVILQKFFGSIYTGTTGIGAITMTACVSDTTPDSTAYSSANITIAARELAEFNSARIAVTTS